MLRLDKAAISGGFALSVTVADDAQAQHKPRISKVKIVGVPLDLQGKRYTGIYPSMGPGEPLAKKISGFAIGHGLFSLLDAFPFQHPEAPELAVSIPLANRLFGQGARATFADFRVETDAAEVDDDD